MSVWNPFKPTQRDIQRTTKLADKTPVIAGLLWFAFFPAGMVYLNRGINSLKLTGYTLLIILLVNMTGVKLSKKTIDFISFTSHIAMTLENVRAVTLARKRKSQQDLMNSESS